MAGFKKYGGSRSGVAKRHMKMAMPGTARSDYRNGLLEIAGGQRINASNRNPAARVRERVRMSIEAAPLTNGLSSAQRRGDDRRADGAGKARLALARSAAARTSVAMQTNNTGGGRARVAGVQARSDGQVQAYTRMQNGQAIFVSGYARV